MFAQALPLAKESRIVNRNSLTGAIAMSQNALIPPAAVAAALGVEERRSDWVLEHGVVGEEREPLVLRLAAHGVVGALRHRRAGWSPSGASQATNSDSIIREL